MFKVFLAKPEKRDISFPDMNALPQITSAQLNAVANLIEEATGTKPDKNTVFDVVIGGLVKAGIKFDEAYEMVFGPGTYGKMIDEVYEALRNAPRKG